MNASFHYHETEVLNLNYQAICQGNRTTDRWVLILLQHCQLVIRGLITCRVKESSVAIDGG